MKGPEQKDVTTQVWSQLNNTRGTTYDLPETFRIVPIETQLLDFEPPQEEKLPPLELEVPITPKVQIYEKNKLQITENCEKEAKMHHNPPISSEHKPDQNQELNYQMVIQYEKLT